MGMNGNKEEKVAAKFKVGDRVQVAVDQGDLVEKGTKFTVTAVGGTHTFYYEGDPNGAGVWEKNLKLVEAASTTESVAVDFSEVNVGDRVRLTGNDEVHEFVVDDIDLVEDNVLALYSLNSRIYIGSRTKLTLEILERAKPVLPTEPGLYVESRKAEALSLTNVWLLTNNGRWLSAADSKYDDRAEEYAPFTRLMPAESND